MVELTGHTTPETAYVVADYPYGFKLRTTIRFWIEHHPRHGYRFCSQTVNPKNGRLNAPKASTYNALAGAMYLDEQNHVTWDGVTEFAEPSYVLAFLEKFKGADITALRAWAAAKVAAYTKLVALNDRGVSGWTINGVRQPLAEGDAARNRESLVAWQQVAERLARA